MCEITLHFLFISVIYYLKPLFTGALLELNFKHLKHFLIKHFLTLHLLKL